MYIYLLMAVFWVVLGVALLAWHWLDPQARYRDVFGTGISAGWLGIVLAVYNLVRWWSGRTQRLERRFREEIARRQSEKGDRAGKPQPADPTFDFGRPNDKDETADRP